ncbi:hypothetical protein SVIOM342S_08144 [Streptomyces violaceorubidus]
MISPYAIREHRAQSTASAPSRLPGRAIEPGPSSGRPSCSPRCPRSAPASSTAARGPESHDPIACLLSTRTRYCARIRTGNGGVCGPSIRPRLGREPVNFCETNGSRPRNHPSLGSTKRVPPALAARTIYQPGGTVGVGGAGCSRTPTTSRSSSRTRTSSSSMSGSATCRASCSTSRCPPRRSTPTPSRPSTDRRSAASRPSTSRTWPCTDLSTAASTRSAGQDAQHQLLHPRPDHGRALPRPAERGEEGRGVPGLHGHRRHGVLRSRGRVLRLRLRPLRHQRPVLLPHRLRGRRLEHRCSGGQPRLQGPLQGRLLPGPRRSTTSPTCAPRSPWSWSGPA